MLLLCVDHVNIKICDCSHLQHPPSPPPSPSTHTRQLLGEPRGGLHQRQSTTNFTTIASVLTTTHRSSHRHEDRNKPCRYALSSSRCFLFLAGEWGWLLGEIERGELEGVMGSLVANRRVGRMIDQIDQNEKAPWARQRRSRSCWEAQEAYVSLQFHRLLPRFTTSELTSGLFEYRSRRSWYGWWSAPPQNQLG